VTVSVTDTISIKIRSLQSGFKDPLDEFLRSEIAAAKVSR